MAFTAIKLFWRPYSWRFCLLNYSKYSMVSCPLVNYSRPIIFLQICRGHETCEIKGFEFYSMVFSWQSSPDVTY